MLQPEPLWYYTEAKVDVTQEIEQRAQPGMKGIEQVAAGSTVVGG